VASIVEQNSADQQRKQQEQEQQKQAITRSHLVQKLLAAGPDIREFMNDLLTVQAIVVNGTEAAGFLLEPGEGGMQLRNVAHIRPDSSDNETRTAALQAFTEIVGECLKQGKDGVIDVGTANESIEPQFCLVTLLRNENNIVAASCVITRARDQERAQQRLETMRLVAGYFDLWLLKRANETALATTQRHQDVLQSAAAFANGETFNGAAANLCNELVSRTSASRVSLGWVKLRSVKLLAMSNTEQFDRKQELSVSIVKAMEECVDQGEVVQYDPDPTGHTTNNITRSAQALARLENGNKIVSLPLRHRNEVVGVLTLEYPPTRMVTPALTTSLAVAAEVLAPQVYDRYQNDRWLAVKIGQSITHNSKYIFGPRHTLAKVIFATLIGLVLLVTLWKPMYTVSAPFQFVPVNKSTISAPFAGVIEDVKVQPGQTVEAGAPLLSLKTDELQKEKLEYEYKKLAAEAAAQEVLNNADPRDDGQYQQQMYQAKAAGEHVKKLEQQIARATIKAPIAGRVLKGDLTEKKLSTVKEGDPLMEIAPIDATGDLHAELRVNERDIQKIKDGSSGELATTSSPSDKHKFTVTRIVPLGEAKEAKNVFKVYATVDGGQSTWQPGQEGEARVDWETRPLYWHGLHRLWEWARLKLWI
jgi:multidrug efflux pump subunit AcrA (membrane-fusion protein)